MISVSPSQGFYFLDPMGIGGLNYGNNITATSGNNNSNCSHSEDPNKKIRKPYTITKSRESWTDQEHDKFLEALQLFDRDWKKIEAFVGSKTVIQIRSHAQKYFLKVQKTGTSEHVPPPRPKRKAAHPYPQKAPKAAPVVSQVAGPVLSSSLEQGFIYRPDSSAVLGNPVSGGNFPSWNNETVVPVNCSQASGDDAALAVQKVSYNCGSSSSNESTPRTLRASEIVEREDQRMPMRVIPDFAQVYSFIGSVFDPSSRGDRLQKLKQMDPINLETAVLLMQNLSINLMNPEFENHRHLLASYDSDVEREKSDGPYSNMAVDNLYSNMAVDNLGSAISTT